jgi:hypothetical protein
MIYILIGGVGSGKSLSMCREISTRNNLCFANFRVNYPNARIIKESDIIIAKKNTRDKIIGYDVNWSFFDTLKENGVVFDIFLDEFHDLMSSRRSMSNRNLAISQWMAQIRKILGNTKHNHLFIATQTLKKVDVNIRDLCHFVVEHESRELSMELLKGMPEYNKNHKNALMVKRTIYGSGCLNDGVESYLHNVNILDIDGFIGNEYYNKYDSFEIINK